VTLAILTVVSTSGMLAVSGVASSAPIASGTPGVSILAQNGFGDRNNSYAWSMGWYRGKLYVGTGRDELCVENEIVQFYFPSTRQYSTNPSPNVSCPRNPYRMSLQAQIWQYTPPGTTTTTTAAPSTGKWKLVYRSPLIRNPMTKGERVARDEAYRGMVVWRDHRGKRALFAAGVSPDEYLPPLLKSHPPVLMRTFDGVHWQTLHMPSVVVHFPNGNDRPMGFRSLMVWRHHLFVTATPDITGDGALMEVTRPWSDHPGLRQVSGPQYDVFEVQTFDGGLYIGTGNKQVGYGVYRTFTYHRSGPFTFHQVVGGGAGRGTEVNSVVSMHVYRNELYVGSSGWYNQGTIPVSELIRISRRGHWQLVVGNPRNLPDGTTMYPISGLYDGFFSPFAAHFWRMEDQDGGLYLGTNDWAYTLQQDKRYAWLQETVLAGVLGFNLWATCDGTNWFAVTRNAFDGNEYNFGGRNLVTGGPQGQDLYIGTANQAQGTTIFDDQADACGSLLKGTRQAVARPGALMTNTLRQGTLLSWQRSADASNYVIERAPFFSVTVGLEAPPTAPDGWHFDDAVPTVTEPGAPGSVTVTLSLPGGFTPVGTTASPSFVDPTPGHYVYEVVAKSALGAGSSPSNVVVAPFGGAPTTFASLRSALGAPRSKRAPVAVAAAAAGSRLERLLVAAETASARGEYALAMGDIVRLQASAGDNEELAAVAARVERRLQYAGIAGAP
jgi:hypothetical protein